MSKEYVSGFITLHSICYTRIMSSTDKKKQMNKWFEFYIFFYVEFEYKCILADMKYLHMKKTNWNECIEFKWYLMFVAINKVRDKVSKKGWWNRTKVKCNKQHE